MANIMEIFKYAAKYGIIYGRNPRKCYQIIEITKCFSQPLKLAVIKNADT